MLNEWTKTKKPEKRALKTLSWQVVVWSLVTVNTTRKKKFLAPFWQIGTFVALTTHLTCVLVACRFNAEKIGLFTEEHKCTGL